MKNLLKCITLIIGISILFSSCSHEGISLTKRHYRNGYYVEHSTKPSTPKAKEPVHVADQPALVAQQTIEPQTDNDVLANADKVNETGQKESAPANSVVSKKPNRKSGSQLAASSMDSKINAPEIFLENKLPIKKLMTRSSGGHGLLWTIIVILLIIWLIALLTGGWGLGGLLWLILVVALVLLILRLLGIF